LGKLNKNRRIRSKRKEMNNIKKYYCKEKYPVPVNFMVPLTLGR